MEKLGLIVEVRLPGHPVRQKSQTRNRLLRHIMDDAALIRRNYESIRKATRAVLKRAGLCISSTGGYLEQQAA
jgi:hypothetical protein